MPAMNLAPIRAALALGAALLAFALPAQAQAPGAPARPLHNLVDIEGMRENQLIGYGLVVGLNGTGDTLNNIPFTKQSLQAMLERMGVNIRGSTIRTGNVAAVMVTGNLNPHEIESLMDSEIETHHNEAHAPAAAVTRLAGGLPAFGIVAAVLGVVNTMGSVGQPPAVLGGMIGSALVGTFLGILLAYGFAEPLAGLMEQKIDEDGKELQCIKTTLLASMQGYAPQVAIEFGRKVLYSTERPTFSELEGHVKGKK